MDDHVGPGKMPLDGLGGGHGELFGALEGEVAGHAEGDVGEVVGAGAAGAQAIHGQYAGDGHEVVDEIVAQVLLGLGLVAGGIAGRRGIEQCVDGLVGKPPTDAEDDAGDNDGGNGVGVLEPWQGEAFAGEGGCEADHDRERGPHVGGEVDGIGEQSVRAVQAGNAAESARAGEIDNDGNQQHGERPQRRPERKVLVKEDALNRLGDNPEARAQHDEGLNQGGERLSFAVAVVVVCVGGAVGDLDREQGDGGGDEVDGGMGRLAQHAERAGEHAGEQLEQRDDACSDDGENCGRALGSVRLARGYLAHGRWAHGKNATGSATRAHRQW